LTSVTPGAAQGGDRGVTPRTGAHGACDRHRPVRRDERKIAGLERGVAAEGGVDRVLEVFDGRDRIRDDDLVDEPGRPADAGRDVLGFVALVLPLGRSGEGHDAVPDVRVDASRNAAREHQRL
jgi:hypothetical protein